MASISIIILYFLQHLSSILLTKKTKSFVILFCVIGVASFVLIYILKKPSYDLISYENSMDYAFVYEPGYYALTRLIKLGGFSNGLTLTIIRIILASLFFFAGYKFFGERAQGTDKLVLVLFIVSSVAFTLGVNNAIRQSYSSILMILAIFYYQKRRLFWFFVFTILGTLFHKSTIGFILYIVFINSLLTLFYEGRLWKIKFAKFTSEFNLFLLLVIPAFALFVLLLVASSTKYGRYLGVSYADASEGLARTSAIIKIGIISVIFALSEIKFGKFIRDNSHFTILRFLRFGFFFLVFWFSLHPLLDEIAGRILYFYFVIELFLILVAYLENKRDGVVIILLSYTFAINAINILSGGQ